MIKILSFIFLFSLSLYGEVKYNIFITSFTEDKKENANKYKDILNEYLVLNNINKKVILNKTDNLYTIKIVNFNNLQEVKEIHNKIKSDFKDAFVQKQEMENIDKVHQSAMEYLKDEEYQKAYNILYKSYQKNNYNNQTLFLLAKTAKDNDDIKSAIRFYEELIESDPTAHRARLDLATLYYEDEQYEKAQEQFLIVKSSNIPSQVETNIENYKLKKQIEEQKNYNIFASIGYMKDSNVNAGPQIDTVTMYDLEFTLSDSAKETDDTASIYKLGASLYSPFKSFLLNSSFYVNKVNYSEEDDYDNLSFSLSTSPIFYRNNTIYMFPLSFTNVDLGSSEDYYMKNISFYPTMKKRISPLFSYILKLNLATKKFESTPTKDGSNYGLTYGFEVINDATSKVAFDTYINRYNSEDKIYSYNNIGIDFSYDNLITDRLFFVGKLNYDVSAYDKIESAFSVKKDVYSLSANLNFIYDLNYYNSTLTFSYNNQHNSSNIDLYRYKKSLAMLLFSVNY